MAMVKVGVSGFPRWARLAAAKIGRVARQGAWDVVLGLAVGLVAAYQLGAWWRSPEHRVRQFVACARRNDARGMLALASPDEVERLRLSPAKLNGLLRDASGSPIGITLAGLQWEPLPEGQTAYNRWARLAVRDRDGHVLAGESGGPLKVIVQSYKTDSGWKIGMSSLILTLLAARTGGGMRNGSYASLCVRHGVSPEVFWPHNYQWQRAPGAPQKRASDRAEAALPGAARARRVLARAAGPHRPADGGAPPDAHETSLKGGRL